MIQSKVAQGQKFCSSCEQWINEKYYDRHQRKHRGEDVQQPILPIQKQTSSWSNNRDIDCGICGTTMSIHQHKAHYYLCTSPKAPCQFCGRLFYLFRLENHQNNCYINRLTQRLQELKQQARQDHGVQLKGEISIDICRLLIYDVFPALKSMDKGLKVSDIEQIPKKQLEENKNCTICQDEIFKGQKPMELPCKDVFHEQCLKKWLVQSSACPNCRGQVKPTKLSI